MNDQQIPPVVTIDGPAGSGKGTLAQKLALHLKWNFLDSGALYRAAAHLVTENHVCKSNIDEVTKLLRGIEFLSVPARTGPESEITVGGIDVSRQIRTPECAQLASELAAVAQVRETLLNVQREYNRHPGLVADGRDMGSVVFPEAIFKVFLTATLECRAKRKHIQLQQQGIYVNFDMVYHNLASRDKRDTRRSHAPLVIPNGAKEIDSSSLSVDGVLSCVLSHLMPVLNE